jgi:hypothetical protein
MRLNKQNYMNSTEQQIHPRTIVSVSLHYENNPTKRVTLEQNYMNSTIIT